MVRRYIYYNLLFQKEVHNFFQENNIEIIHEFKLDLTDVIKCKIEDENEVRVMTHLDIFIDAIHEDHKMYMKLVSEYSPLNQ